MIFHISVMVYLFGFAMLLGILGVMRGLYRAGIFHSPDIPCDAYAKVALDDCRRQSNRRHNAIGDLRRCQSLRKSDVAPQSRASVVGQTRAHRNRAV